MWRSTKRPDSRVGCRDSRGPAGRAWRETSRSASWVRAANGPTPPLSRNSRVASLRRFGCLRDSGEWLLLRRPARSQRSVRALPSEVDGDVDSTVAARHARSCRAMSPKETPNHGQSARQEGAAKKALPRRRLRRSAAKKATEPAAKKAPAKKAPAKKATKATAAEPRSCRRRGRARPRPRRARPRPRARPRGADRGGAGRGRSRRRPHGPGARRARRRHAAARRSPT